MFDLQILNEAHVEPKHIQGLLDTLHGEIHDHICEHGSFPLEIFILTNSNLKRCIFLLIQLQEWLIEIIFEALINLILLRLCFAHPHNVQKRVSLRMELLDSLRKHGPLTISF